ncbi:hypothetical protein [Cryptosporangium aurantiacum]|uniref:5-bromo-4-chloroindolyl phosphate hydrolysis protein n=1 Tax=Cryptosporangium aurantiacum TaxID=134849 RepID=A0A1M7RPD3_9ACTN|nr:hypothetical protein [Cryptosporangium aurantiacum]SHN48124.1 hypothetical protein SAMN05443668_13421 [Cryptosporangium aurantiacum]
MGTSRAVAFLGSRKNIVGCAGGLAGLGAAVAGFGGAWWWVLPVGLYAAGVLATPPARVRLVASGPDAADEAGAIRRDLSTLLARLDPLAGRLPDGAHAAVRDVAALLFELLDRPDALAAAPDQAYGVTRVVRSDLPISLETYLALPRWYGSGQPADDLAAQLELIRADVERIAAAVYAADAQRLTDHTRYLRDRVNRLEQPD